MEAQVTPFRWIIVLPNVLSFLRLVLALALPFLPELWWPTVVVLAGVSDLLDGFLARRFRVTSWQGGLLDAVADKLFVFSALLTLTMHGRLNVWQVAALLSRDWTVAVLAIYIALRRQWFAFRLMRPRLLGKATTVILFALFIAVVCFPDAHRWHALAFLLATVTSLLAGGDYLVSAQRAQQRAAQPPPTAP